jgi:hypothetical protein
MDGARLHLHNSTEAKKEVKTAKDNLVKRGGAWEMRAAKKQQLQKAVVNEQKNSTRRSEEGAVRPTLSDPSAPKAQAATENVSAETNSGGSSIPEAGLAVPPVEHGHVSQEPRTATHLDVESLAAAGALALSRPLEPMAQKDRAAAQQAQAQAPVPEANASVSTPARAQAETASAALRTATPLVTATVAASNLQPLSALPLAASDTSPHTFAEFWERREDHPGDSVVAAAERTDAEASAALADGPYHIQHTGTPAFLAALTSWLCGSWCAAPSENMQKAAAAPALSATTSSSTNSTSDSLLRLSVEAPSPEPEGPWWNTAGITKEGSSEAEFTEQHVAEDRDHDVLIGNAFRQMEQSDYQGYQDV